MSQHFSLVEPVAQQRIAFPQKANPHRRIHQYQYRRGISLSFGALPPREARRRALSFSIRLRKPSWSNRVFSLIPVSFAAFSNKASSKFNVVLMHIYMHECVHPSSLPFYEREEEPPGRGCLNKGIHKQITNPWLLQPLIYLSQHQSRLL